MEAGQYENEPTPFEIYFTGSTLDYIACIYI